MHHYNKDLFQSARLGIRQQVVHHRPWNSACPTWCGFVTSRHLFDVLYVHAGPLISRVWFEDRQDGPHWVPCVSRFAAVSSLSLKGPLSKFDHFATLATFQHLRELCLIDCIHYSSAAYLQQFSVLAQLTCLHLHCSKQLQLQARDVCGIFYHLSNLQHVTITGMKDGDIPDDTLAFLPGLTSFCTDRLQEGLTSLQSLQHLTISNDLPFRPFGDDFSRLSCLTSIQVGSKRGTDGEDIVSLHYLPQLRKLVLNGPIKLIHPAFRQGAEEIYCWHALTTLTHVQHLELRDVDHIYRVFAQLGHMSQLTSLYFSSCSKVVKVEELDKHLTNLSRLVNLKLLTCIFDCSAFLQAPGEPHSPDLACLGEPLRHDFVLTNPTCVCTFGCKCTMICISRSFDSRACLV